jgi:cysteine desulfurase / selenocysteine lyase
MARPDYPTLAPAASPSSAAGPRVSYPLPAMATLWEDLRGDFPGLDDKVYLNAAATSLPPRSVREAVAAFYRELEEGGDRHWDLWLEKREAVRRKVARFVGAQPEEIAFVPNTSAGINLIADLLDRDGPVLSDELEFPTVTLPWIHRGVPVRFVAAVEGVLRLESFVEGQAPHTATIAISHVQFSNGCRQDLDAFGRIKGHRHLVVCGSQSVGAFPVDVRASGIDALATAGHKWLGAGFGAGFCYVGQALLDARPPRAIGWMSVDDPFAFDNRHPRVLPQNARTEMGCPPFGAIFALGAAVDYLSGIGIERIAERVLALNMYLTFHLGRESFEVLSPGGEHRSGETLVRLPDPKRARAFLLDRGVHVTEKPEGVRISTHFYNSEQDVDACVEALVAYRDGLLL